MSYESMAREDVECDFPPCSKEFWKKPGENNAIVKNGKILAFCRTHSMLLSERGVVLRPLADIHAERIREENEQLVRTQTERQEAFIESLKRG
ncbi:MAG: hypothetical protein V4473_02400 [Patescibacteria group bacterium]